MYKIGYDHQSVQSVAGKLSCRDSIEALYQNRNPLVQEAGLLSLARNCSPLRVAAISAAAPASRAVLSMYDSASGHVTVTSQHNDLPLCQGTSVTPSGLFRQSGVPRRLFSDVLLVFKFSFFVSCYYFKVVERAILKFKTLLVLRKIFGQFPLVNLYQRNVLMRFALCVCLAACTDSNCAVCIASTCYACLSNYVKDTNGICQGMFLACPFQHLL